MRKINLSNLAFSNWAAARSCDVGGPLQAALGVSVDHSHDVEPVLVIFVFFHPDVD
jgi:hypothetical protein